MNAIQTKRNLAFCIGVALLAPAFLSAFATPARADDDKKYQTGAAVLGAAAAYFAVKGKPLPGVLAGAGAYYAYKKGRDAQRYGYDSGSYGSGVYEDDRPRRNNRRRDDLYSRRDNRDESVYDDSYRRDESYSRDDDAYDYDLSSSDIFSDDANYDTLKKSAGIENAARPILK